MVYTTHFFPIVDEVPSSHEFPPFSALPIPFRLSSPSLACFGFEFQDSERQDHINSFLEPPPPSVNISMTCFAFFLHIHPHCDYQQREKAELVCASYSLTLNLTLASSQLGVGKFLLARKHWKPIRAQSSLGGLRKLALDFFRFSGGFSCRCNPFGIFPRS